MITKITNNNVSFFDSIIPADELDNLISRPDYFGIGVTRYNKEEEVPAGVLIYRLDQDATGLIPASIKITYLFVAEDQRRKCVGSDLICKLTSIATKNNIETITIDTYATEEHSGLREFLAGWHFDYSPVYLEELIVRLGDVNFKKLVSEIKTKNPVQGVELSNITSTQFREFKTAIRKDSGEGVPYAFYEIDKSYYDDRLSKVIVTDDGKVRAGIFVHKNIGGVLEINLMKWLSPLTESDALALLIDSYVDAKKIYGDDIYISARIFDQYFVDLMDEVVPDHTTIQVFRGILTKDTEVNPVDWIGAKEGFAALLDSTLEYEEEEE